LMILHASLSCPIQPFFCVGVTSFFISLASVTQSLHGRHLQVLRASALILTLDLVTCK